jgi:hypothetical protein
LFRRAVHPLLSFLHINPLPVKTIIQKALLLIHDGKPEEAERVLEDALIDPPTRGFDHNAESLFAAIGYPEMKDKAIDFSHDLFEKMGKGDLNRSRAFEQILNSSYPAPVQLEIAFHTGKHIGELEEAMSMRARGHIKELPEELKKMIDSVAKDLGLFGPKKD